MNKSVVFGAIIIGAAIVASPFIFDTVKNKQRKDKEVKMNIQLEIVDVLGFYKAAILYKKDMGECPKKASELVGVYIKREPKDRFGITYKTKGDCEFNSSSDISSEDHKDHLY
jgi:hypothetical protein